jgi:hypothetical protein
MRLSLQLSHDGVVDEICYSTSSTLPGCASGVIQKCKALGTMYSRHSRTSNREERCRQLALSCQRLGSNGMVNRSKLLYASLLMNKPMVLTGLNQNGTWFRAWAANSHLVDKRTTGVKAGPNPLSAKTEHGKPKTLLQRKATCKRGRWGCG